MLRKLWNRVEIHLEVFQGLGLGAAATVGVDEMAWTFELCLGPFVFAMGVANDS